MPDIVEPDARLRRSFVYRKLLDLGARFAPINGGAVAIDFGEDVEDETRLAGRLGLPIFRRSREPDSKGRARSSGCKVKT